MVCRVCARLKARWPICSACRDQLIPANDRLVGNLRLIAAFEHLGTGRKLMHEVKYKGLTWYLDLVSATVAPTIGQGVLVPIPRSWARLVRYGIDPALELANRLSRETGLAVERPLARPLHRKRRAGGDHRAPVGDFRLTSHLPQEPLLLVDDVFTTGATMEAAIRSVGSEKVRAAVVANVVPEVSSLLRRPVPHPTREF